jgi:hypothetical protein
MNMTLDHKQAMHKTLARCADDITQIGSTIYNSEQAEAVVTFLDSCCWALAFGGPFGDEIICVAHEVLKEQEIVDQWGTA